MKHENDRKETGKLFLFFVFVFLEMINLK